MIFLKSFGLWSVLGSAGDMIMQGGDILNFSLDIFRDASLKISLKGQIKQFNEKFIVTLGFRITPQSHTKLGLRTYI